MVGRYPGIRCEGGNLIKNRQQDYKTFIMVYYLGRGFKQIGLELIRFM